MELKHIVLHQIIKKENTEPSLNCSNNLLDESNSDVVEFVETLVKSFGSKNPTYGIFQEDENNYPFQKKVREYRVNDDFLVFSKDSMNILKKEINVPKAIGGYVVFTHYEEKQIDYLVTIMKN